ncbi:MAG: DNA repair protein RecN, partial [Firmicutes bacterium]|nr:DNA repair protein RecN [Bacillota bacterium]
IKAKVQNAQRQKELYEYEVKEIEDARLQPEEDIKLNEEIDLMQNSEKIFSSLCEVQDLLFNGDYNANDFLGRALNEIEGISNYSDELKGFLTTISDAYYALSDIQGEIRSYRDSINFAPELLEEKIERSEYIEKLKRKYGSSVEEILAYRDKISENLNLMDDADAQIAELENKMVLCKKAFDTAADRLNVLRDKTALLIEKEVTKELKDLNFNNALFSVKLSPCAASERGTTSAEFLITTNKGEELKPLAKIASGGELSRIMLALKRITGDLDNIPTMIFDEIDAGISGATAGIVGDKLKSISKNHQIICITHLPQIAAKGDAHYRIQKTSDAAATYTTVTPLDDKQLVEELARLLSGTEITDAARQQAKALLSQK